ncbi:MULTISPECIES: L-lactate dehydrogenase [unclassified Pseudovibrio]|uniref:L-lactate dehydrogenase n=1 Tax=unclassified Pseudovibrio TaxID=2627060 RepID=UPI0007AEE534|nr:MULTISPECIES: L-lactate dehydrogenase [unclassified Pseudovibrio]KZL27993.1 L-lactate dehydrogenase [Pseudovibrio sp. WM33]KZL28668.1 L-lactate dehydrogenase [Pseudovibrio sp. Ad37]
MKIGVVGVGAVGSTAAYAMAMNGVGNEIVLVDYNPKLAIAQAEDILHATPFARPMSVIGGDYSDLKDAAVVVIAAGVNQQPGETRIELLARNAGVFAKVIPEVLKYAPNAILIIATNPVDIMTQVATEISGLPRNRVIGSGTILDTARFRTLLGKHLGITPTSVHADVLGEHGDSEVLIWSGAKAGNTPLFTFAEQINKPITQDVRDRIDHGVRYAAYSIIEGKGATNYGIGAGLSRIVKAIVTNEHAVISLSIVNEEIVGVRDTALSVPRVLGADGIEATLFPSMDELERSQLQASAVALETAAKEVLSKHLK